MSWFLDNIDHDWLLRMLEERLDDAAFLNLIRKWLNAGIPDTDDKLIIELKRVDTIKGIHDAPFCRACPGIKENGPCRKSFCGACSGAK